MAILVSNNPYRLGRAIGSGTRPRLNRGLLGNAALAPAQATSDGAVLHKLGLQQWTASAFNMHADHRVPGGVDGEAINLEPPVYFASAPARCE